MTSNGASDNNTNNWKNKAYFMGGLVGLTIGLVAAYLYVRVSDENGGQAPTQIKTMDLLGLSVSLIGLIRQITDLGAKSGK